MKFRTLPLLVLCSLFLLSGMFGCRNSEPGPKPVAGILYVKKPGEDVFSKKEGEILDVTPRKIKIKVKSDSGGDEELIYTRDAVAQVVLDKKADQRWKEIVEEDWNKPVAGILYVKKPGEDGVFSKKEGEILDVTPRKIKIKVKSDSGGDEELIYARDAVAQVVLNDSADQRWKEIVEEDWNREPPKMVNALQIVVSSVLPDVFWREVSSTVSIVIIIFVIIFLLFLGAHRLYLMFVVAAEERTLNQAKLGMEISKLHYDIQSLKKNLKLITEIPPDDLKEVLKAAWLHEELPGWQEFLRTTRESKPPEMEAEESIEMGKLRPESPKLEKQPVTASETAAREAEIPRARKAHFSILDFLKHTIFRMHTEEQEQVQSNSWRKKWRHYEEKPAWNRIARKWATLIAIWYGIILLFPFSVSALIDVFLPFFLPYSDPTFREEISFAPLIMIPIFLILFIVSFGFLLRLWSKQKIIRTTYREIFNPQE